MKQGVNIYGYVFAESGMGEVTRLTVEAVRNLGMPYAVIPVTSTLSRQETSFGDFGSGEPEYDINIVGVNADSMSLFVQNFGFSALNRRYTVGIWAWELEAFPSWMARSADLVDEVWGISTFTADSVARIIPKPAIAIPLPIRCPDIPRICRADLGLPEAFLYLFCFDLDSIFERKNPLGLIEAFKRAFPEEGGARLVMKSINGDRHADGVSKIRAAIGKRRDIIFMDRYVSIEEQQAMIASCDVYISLHRAEGFGLTMAEAMAFAKPVIGTGYSGNMDFMNDQNSLLIPYRMVPVGEGSDPYPAEAQWADPDLDVAAEAIRRVFEDGNMRQKLGRRAKEDVETLHSPAVRARMIGERLKEIREKLDAGSLKLGESPSEAGGKAGVGLSAEKLLEKRIANISGLLHRGPEKMAPAIFPGLSSFLRKILYRMDRSYLRYQHEVAQALTMLLHDLHDCETTAIHNIDSTLVRQLEAAAENAEELAGQSEILLGQEAVNIARPLRLLAARLRGLGQ